MVHRDLFLREEIRRIFAWVLLKDSRAGYAVGYSTLQSRLGQTGRYYSQSPSQYPAKSDLSSTLPHHRIPPPTGFSSSSTAPRQRNLAHIGSLPRHHSADLETKNYRAGYGGHTTSSSGGPESNIWLGPGAPSVSAIFNGMFIKSININIYQDISHVSIISVPQSSLSSSDILNFSFSISIKYTEPTTCQFDLYEMYFLALMIIF